MAVSKKFLQSIAILILLMSYGYLYWASFADTPLRNKELIASVKDFLQNALLLVIGYFFGASVKNSVE